MNSEEKKEKSNETNSEIPLENRRFGSFDRRQVQFSDYRNDFQSIYIQNEFMIKLSLNDQMDKYVV